MTQSLETLQIPLNAEKRTRLVGNVNMYLNKIEDARYRITDYESQKVQDTFLLDELPKIKEMMMREKEKNPANSAYDHVAAMIGNSIANRARALRNHDGAIYNLQSALASHKTKLEKCQLELDALPKETVLEFTRAGVQAIAASTKVIKPSSVTLSEDCGNKLIEWTFDMLYAPINLYNMGIRGCFLNDKVFLPVGPCRVRVNLTTKKVFFNPAQADAGYKYYISSKTVHPHVTSATGTGCMGTLAGPMAEAISDSNIEMIMAIAQMFLQTVTPADAAGSYWTNYFRYHLNALIKGTRMESYIRRQENVEGKIILVHYKWHQDPETKKLTLLRSVNQGGDWLAFGQSVKPGKRTIPTLPTETKVTIKSRFKTHLAREQAALNPQPVQPQPVQPQPAHRKDEYVYTIEEALIA